MSLESAIIQVKKEIKEWEHQFMTSNGHAPGKNDVKGNIKIDKLYKTYKKLKQKQSKLGTPKSDRIKPLIDNITNLSDEEFDKESTTNSIKEFSELGPTPQGAGKVLSIFDVKLTPPESSPLKTKSLPVPIITTPSRNNEFKTPTKLRVIDNNVQKSANSKSSFMQKLSNIANSKSPMKTPTKQPDIPAFETPQYLNRNIEKFDFSQHEKKHSPFDPQPESSPPIGSNKHTFTTPTTNSVINFQVSPSPLIKKTNKRLLDVFQAHQSINITKEEQEEYAVDESEEENELHSDDTLTTGKRRAKTQKRTTRNWKMKPTGAINKVDNPFANKDIHKVIEKLERKEEARLDRLTKEGDFTSESESEEEEITQPVNGKKVRMVSTVSNNYKRMKIHYKKNKNWGGRSRR